MRICFVLLVAAATLLASGSATTDADQNKLSTVGTADVIQLMDAEVAAIAKRSLRTSNYDEDEDEDEDEDDSDAEEERGMNVGALDDIVGKATRTSLVDDVLKKFVSTDALENALKDPKQTLFKNMYEGNVSPKRFAQFIKYDLTGNAAHQFENVYKSFNWYSLYRKSLAANTAA